MTSIGEALVAQLVERGVETVFGIPGVHTIELYRGLAKSGIRHITPRHEQGAGFMADGYARVSGKPGVAFVITGPGLTNILTAMAQARADSVPMLVVSGVNTLPTLGKGMGHLHELPNQRALASTIALTSQQVRTAEELTPAMDRVFVPFNSGRPGPTHIEIPLDIVGRDYTVATSTHKTPFRAKPSQILIERAARKLEAAKRPVILAGGGARYGGVILRALAEKIDAPVVQTVNARGLMYNHALGVPASPSLKSVRALIEDSDLVLAVGTELGPTDYDMYATGALPQMSNMIRIDICNEQLARHQADITLHGDAKDTLASIVFEAELQLSGSRKGAERAALTRTAAYEEVGSQYRVQIDILNAIRDAAPEALIVGDSTQPIYAGNLYYDHDRPGGWFNAATGYGALGYGIPAAIGASLADSKVRVICIVGDGGAQFSLSEIMVAVDEKLPITFVVWNNKGYREIAESMQNVGITVVGCDPTPPNFELMAAAFDIPFFRCSAEPVDVSKKMKSSVVHNGPSMIEIEAP